MRPVYRVLRGVAWLALALVLLAFVGAAGAVWLTLPGGDVQAAIPSLSAEVSVSEDADGIPRIRAATPTDAAAALGFLHARARMFQMELMRRAASGRLSEYFGRTTLPYDRYIRLLGLRQVAAAELAGLPADTRAIFDAYARGVNAWIARRGRFSALQLLAFGEPEPWTPVDSLLWGKTMSVYLSGNWRTELARLALARTLTAMQIDALWPAEPGSGRPQAALVPDARLAATATRLAEAVPKFPAAFTLPSEASNEWAVDGTHSASGAPLLAGDPHLAFSLPGFWYLARIDISATHETLAGATAPGVPILVLGRNSHIAWTFTTTGADTQDLFVEQPAGAGRYVSPDGPLPFMVRDETIRVRGGADEVLHVRATRHGPVISDLIDPGGPILALAAANLTPGDAQAAGLLALNRATTVDEAGAAAAAIASPVQNLLVADRQRIALFVSGRVPIRRTGDGSRPQPGADGAHDWLGFASGEELPHVVAPASGRLVNANERIGPAESGVFLSRDWYGDFRARRIRALLAASDKLTAADFSHMQTDVLSTFAQDVLPRLRSVRPTRPQDAAALRILDGWDGAAAMDAPQPLLFNDWIRRFADAMLDRLHVPEADRDAAAPWPDLAAQALGADGAALCGGPCDSLLAASLSASVDALSARYGHDPLAWRWGVAHPAVFPDPLLRAVPWMEHLVEGRIAAPGDDTTIDRGGFRDGDFESVHGASFRAAYDLADLDRSRFVVAPGQSGDPASPLARNFLRRWRDGGTVTLGAETPPAATHITLVPMGEGR
jgi:penicillin amidase